MNSVNRDEPAFPLSVQNDFWLVHDGMSLRDWFAGQALIGIVSRGEVIAEEQAWKAYDTADAMLKVRSRS